MTGSSDIDTLREALAAAEAKAVEADARATVAEAEACNDAVSRVDQGPRMPGFNEAGARTPRMPPAL